MGKVGEVGDGDDSGEYVGETGDGDDSGEYVIDANDAGVEDLEGASRLSERSGVAARDDGGARSGP